MLLLVLLYSAVEGGAGALNLLIIRLTSSIIANKYIYTVSQKKLGHFFTAYNFRNIEQIFTKFGVNQSLFILNIEPEFI